MKLLTGILFQRWLLCALLATAGLCRAQVRISSLSIGDDGKIRIVLDGSAGEYVVQSSDDLSPDQWVGLCRIGSDGSTKEVSEPVEEDARQRFYRIVSVPQANDFHLTGTYAQAVVNAVDYADLQAAFGLAFTQQEAVLPDADALSVAMRNARVYAATVAGLSLLAQDIRDSFAQGSQPSAAEVAAALAADLASGVLNGQNSSGQAIEIGSTGAFLSSFTEQDFIDRVEQVKGLLPGIYNVAFTTAGGGALAPAVPADWGNFYWDSSDWQ